MSPALLLSIVSGYFLLLLGIAWWTSRGAGEHAFYSGERKSLWWVVAFGMIGTSLSGVTFISVPGMVQAKGWSYFQLVLGFAIGYWIVAGMLLPLYYRMGLTSIYGYLRERFGMVELSHGRVLLHPQPSGRCHHPDLCGAERHPALRARCHGCALRGHGFCGDADDRALHLERRGEDHRLDRHPANAVHARRRLVGTIVYIGDQAPGMGEWS
jgi:hypothetical protein